MQRNGSSSERPDVIVVGAGHNGLTAAGYLARAGRRVLVLEASPTAGGMTSTNATIAGAPRHLINEGSIQASLFRASSIAQDLDLARYGFREKIADPQHVQLSPDGSSLAIWADPRRTAEELKYFSARDARNWLELAETLNLAMDVLIPYMITAPVPPVSTILTMLKGVAKHRTQLMPLVRMFQASHAEVIDELFTSELARGALAEMQIFEPMMNDGTGWALIYLGLVQHTNSSRFVGGTGALPKALMGYLRDHGGTVRTSAAVEEILVRAGRVVGVRLAGGEEIASDYVLTNCNPRQTFNDLLAPGLLPPEIEARTRRIPTTLTRAASLKIDVACSGRIDLKRHNAWRKDGLDLRKPVVCWHTFEQHVAAWEASITGKWPKEPIFLTVVPTAIDPTQAPEGQDTFWLWSGITPALPDRPWAEVKEGFGAQVLKEAAQYYDGLDTLEIGHNVLQVPELAARFNADAGNVYHVDPVAQRFGLGRPAVGVGNYETPIGGLYISGAGTHPSGGICGLPGKLAAETLLKGQGGGRRRWLPRFSRAGATVRRGTGDRAPGRSANGHAQTAAREITHV
jgi:phytoene dehydrogenase-like protein